MFEPSPVEKEIARKAQELPDADLNELLLLAGVDPGDNDARCRLLVSFKGALFACDNRVAAHPPAKKYNKPLNAVSDAAEKLIHAIKVIDKGRDVPPHVGNTLRLYFASPFSFAGQSGDSLADITAAIKCLSEAAKAAIDNAPYSEPGPLDTLERKIAEHAFDFFVRHSSERLATTPSGSWGKFASAFYEKVMAYQPNNKWKPLGEGIIRRVVESPKNKTTIEKRRRAATGVNSL